MIRKRKRYNILDCGHGPVWTTLDFTDAQRYISVEFTKPTVSDAYNYPDDVLFPKFPDQRFYLVHPESPIRQGTSVDRSWSYHLRYSFADFTTKDNDGKLIHIPDISKSDIYNSVVFTPNYKPNLNVVHIDFRTDFAIFNDRKILLKSKSSYRISKVGYRNAMIFV